MRKLKVRKAKGIPKYTQPGSGWVKPDTWVSWLTSQRKREETENLNTVSSPCSHPRFTSQVFSYSRTTTVCKY
jgi:hypothetical protein